MLLTPNTVEIEGLPELSVETNKIKSWPSLVCGVPPDWALFPEGLGSSIKVSICERHIRVDWSPSSGV